MLGLDKAQSFIFGAGTDVPTAQSLRKRRELADLLAMQTAGGEYRNWGDGVGSIMKALGYRMIDNKLAPQEDAERQKIATALAGLTGGSYTPSYAAPTSGGFTGAGGVSGAPVAPTGSNPNVPAVDTGNPIYQGLLDRGLPEPVAQGFMMNFADESGLNPGINERNPTVPGSRGGFGLAQWTGPRREALEQYAVHAGKPVSDPNVQLDFLMTELQGPEASAASKFMGADDPGQAAAGIAAHFLRPAPEHLSQRVAEYTGGGMDLGALSGMVGREPDMGKVSQIAEILSNPYADDGQKMVAQALLEREMEAGGGVDPLSIARLGLEQQRLQLDRDKFVQGSREGPKFYGNVQWAQRENPETGELEMVPYQIGTDGSVNYPDLGGAEPLPPTRNVDLGTTQAQVAQAGGNVVNALDKDVAGAAAQGELGQAAGKAAATLGDRGVMVQAAIDQIDRIVADPALPEVLGNIQGRLPPRTQEQANAQAQIDGLQGKVFANAISALVGLGAMSNMEGQTVAQSLAALSQVQDEKAYAAELGRLKALLMDKLAAAQQLAGQAGVGQPPAQPAQPQRLRYNPETGEFE